MQSVRKLFFTSLLVLCCLLSAGCSSQDKNATLYDNKGNLVTLASLSGKWVILNYWASWCPSCRKEIPELNRLAKELKGKDVLLYGIEAEDLPPEEQDAAIKEVGIQYPVLRQDPSESWQLDRVELIPTTIILNPKGKKATVIQGELSADKLLRAIASLKNDYDE
jgi:thiol-disulfide isomerase/thioredoxin